MVKLFKYEWKRYGFSVLILLACTAAVGIITALFMLLFSSLTGTSYDADFVGAATVALLTLLLIAVPYAGYIYPLLSYIADIGKKGMIFLTPCSTWLIILSKLLFGVGVYFVLNVESQCISGLLTLLADTLGNEDISDAVDTFTNMFDYNNAFVGFLISTISGITSIIHSSVSIMACIALARYAVNSIGAQVILTIVFSWLVGIIESMLSVLVLLVFNNEDMIWDLIFSSNITGAFTAGAVVNIIYAAVLYVVASCLTDKKVNLV